MRGDQGADASNRNGSEPRVQRPNPGLRSAVTTFDAVIAELGVPLEAFHGDLNPGRVAAHVELAYADLERHGYSEASRVRRHRHALDALLVATAAICEAEPAITHRIRSAAVDIRRGFERVYCDGQRVPSFLTSR